MFDVEAVLCEDGKHVMFYLYRADELLSTRTQALPVAICEDAFEECRPEWEHSYHQLLTGNRIYPPFL